MLCLWSKLSYCFWNGLKCFWILFFSELWGGWLEFTSVQLVEALVLSPDNHRCDRFYSYLNIRTLANRISYFTSYESRLVFEILTSLQYGSNWRFFYDSEWFQKIIAWLVWNTNIWNPWSTFERGDETIGKMSAKMTKTLSIMVFPNYQDESSVVRSREKERERDLLERPADTGAALMSVSFGENSLSFLSILSRFWALCSFSIFSRRAIMVV